jgi:homopolymeric O-antigen transport system permease protein
LTLTIHRIKVRYKQSVLGLGWALLQPLSLMLVYTVIFSLFTKIPSEGIPYPLFVLGGLLPWIFFQTALSSSATGLVSHSQLITKVYFPREILPITYVLASFFDFLIACVILAAMMVWYQVRLTWEVLYAVPILLVATLFATGLALLFSAVQVRFRDIGIAMPLILQLWMFGTPVVYSYSVVPHHFRSVYLLNPLVGIVENFRRVVVLGIGPDLPLLLISTCAAIAILPVAYLFFKHREATMADII